MNKPLRKVSIVGLLLILALMINVNYLQGTQADKLQTDPLNNRQYLERFNLNRGLIKAGDEVLASSKDTGSKTKKYQREYRNGEVFYPITGYYGAFGETGIERAANSLLNGTDKRLTVRKWWDTFIGKKAPGANVETTIKPQAQRRVYEALKASTTRRAAAVAIDIKSGAIRTMASYPSIDTNRLATNDGNKAQATFANLKKPEFKVSQPALNKAMEETFPPGSAFKIVTAATAMETKGLTKDTSVPTGAYNMPESGRPLKNDHDSGACAGQASLLQSFAESCNTTYGRLAVEMGAPVLAKQAGKFGFGTRTKVEDGMSSAISVSPEDASGDALARTGIGQQDVRASPLEMAMTAGAVANGGRLMKPYLINKITAPDGDTLEKAGKEELGRALSENNAGQLAEMMRAVTTSGTATQMGANIAGKTGTAETNVGFNARWFVGFAPANDPKIAFAVITEGSGYAASATAPIVRTLVQAVNSE